MTALWRRIDAYWMDVAPPERLAAVRILVGLYATLYVMARAMFLASYAGFHVSQFSPVGLAASLGGPLPPALVYAQVVATVVLAPLFLLGWRFRVTGPLFAFSLLWTLTYSNSWGQILHTDNMLVMHVVVLALAPAAHAWSLDARRAGAAPAPSGAYGWPLRLMCALCVIAYLLAGIAKLKVGGSAFVDGDTLRNYIAFDNVRKLELGSIHSPVADLTLPYGGFYTFLAWFTLVIELGAPVAMVHRRAGVWWVAVMWGFHVGVLVLMAIAFVYPLTGVAFASFFRAERLVGRALRRARLIGGGSRAAPAISGPT